MKQKIVEKEITFFDMALACINAHFGLDLYFYHLTIHLMKLNSHFIVAILPVSVTPTQCCTMHCLAVQTLLPF